MPEANHIEGMPDLTGTCSADSPRCSRDAPAPLPRRSSAAPPLLLRYFFGSNDFVNVRHASLRSALSHLSALAVYIIP